MKWLGILILGMAFSFSGCTYGSSNMVGREYEDVSQKIVKGETTKREILNEFGTPLATAKTADGLEKWAYSEVRIIPIPFVPKKVRTLEVVFDRQGKVSDYTFGGMEGY